MNENQKLNAVKRLEQNILRCSPFDAFGFDNVVKINIMIDVILFDRSPAWINTNFLTAEELLVSQPDNVFWQTALDARAWLDGKIDFEDLLFPDRFQGQLLGLKTDSL